MDEEIKDDEEKDNLPEEEETDETVEPSEEESK
jgi:hypothetical protein